MPGGSCHSRSQKSFQGIWCQAWSQQFHQGCLQIIKATRRVYGILNFRDKIAAGLKSLGQQAGNSCVKIELGLFNRDCS